MGERGQVVIPLEFRKRMKLQHGEKFMVLGDYDTLLLKRIKAPAMREFELMLGKGHAHARKHGLAERDLHKAIMKARAKK